MHIFVESYLIFCYNQRKTGAGLHFHQIVLSPAYEKVAVGIKIRKIHVLKSGKLLTGLRPRRTKFVLINKTQHHDRRANHQTA